MLPTMMMSSRWRESASTRKTGRQRIRAWRARSAGFVRTCLDSLAAAGRLRHGLTAEALVSVVQG